jgi:hypothetical protein
MSHSNRRVRGPHAAMRAGVAGVAAAGAVAAVVFGGSAAAGPQPLAASVVLTAVVDGTSNNPTANLVVRGSGAVSASFANADATRGTYQVLFDRNVSACTYSATIAGLGTDVPEPGFIMATGRGGNANGVFVATRNPDQTSGKRRFHLTVTC